jgi:phosphatidylserine/phosphatidylglycerophosphate/cardiolipin synthase-like enzyme
VQVLRTLPASPGDPRGRTEILDAYLEAIGRARTYIYLESQYFSARPIARAVRAALDAHPALEVILVLNQNPDVTAYRGWQDARLTECGLHDHPRVGTFALWSAVPSLRSPGRAEVTQVFVHSKVAVIDDAWATLGTANLDGASLHSYGDDFVSPLGRRVFGRFRNYDLNVALLDGTDGTPSTGVAADLRRRLWSRHLGKSPCDVALHRAKGWLPLWRARAAQHVRELAMGMSSTPGGRVLPYVPSAPHPRQQLAALGIDVDAAQLDLRFDPSWLDVRCNVGWMEKIVPEPLRWWRR